jgi:hypothetical protein
MKMIQTLSDIEYLKATTTLPMELIKEIEKDFLSIFEAENNEVYLLEFRLPPWQTLFVFEKGDHVVLEKLNDPITLEYVEKVEVNQLAYYRCAIRNDHEFQIYYSQINIHDKEIEDWLQEQAE